MDLAKVWVERASVLVSVLVSVLELGYINVAQDLEQRGP